jgi:hypothetical protein
VRKFDEIEVGRFALDGFEERARLRIKKFRNAIERSFPHKERSGCDWRRSHALKVRGERLLEIAWLVRCQHLRSRLGLRKKFFCRGASFSNISPKLRTLITDKNVVTKINSASRRRDESVPYCRWCSMSVHEIQSVHAI